MAVLSRRADRIDFLAQIPLFSNLSRRDLNEVAKRSDEASVPAGTVFSKQGRLGNECYAIVDGKVAVRRNNRTIATHGRGEVIGEMSLLDGKARSASLRAENDSVLLVIHRRDFQYLVDHIPGFARKLMTSLSERLREMNATLDI